MSASLGLLSPHPVLIHAPALEFAASFPSGPSPPAHLSPFDDTSDIHRSHMSTCTCISVCMLPFEPLSGWNKRQEKRENKGNTRSVCLSCHRPSAHPSSSPPFTCHAFPFISRSEKKTTDNCSSSSFPHSRSSLPHVVAAAPLCPSKSKATNTCT